MQFALPALSDRPAREPGEGFTLAAASTLADTASLLDGAIARLVAELARSSYSERRIASELAAILRRLAMELHVVSQERDGASAARRIETLLDLLKAAIESRGAAVTRGGGLVAYPNAGGAERGELRRLEAELARILAMLGMLVARLRALSTAG